MSCESHPPTCDHVICRRKFEDPTFLQKLFLYLNLLQQWQSLRKRKRNPHHDSALTGQAWMLELWNGNDTRFFEQFRMGKGLFVTLLNLLRDKYQFVPFSRVSAEQSLGMLLYILGHGHTFPNVAERFQHSKSTVTDHVAEMLAAVCRLGVDLIRPDDPTFAQDPPKLVRDTRAWPYFRGCIGAIDGTHINLRVSKKKIIPFRNRHGVASTNVMVACDFDLRIMYARVGLEGAQHDSRVFGGAMRHTENVFPRPPEGKFYLADAGYPNTRGFLTPYKGVRYHLPEFRNANRIEGREENFNQLHASLRSMIERTFGVLKARWAILNKMTRFDVDKQMRIIFACMVLHNFIRKFGADDLHMLDIDTRRPQGLQNDVPTEGWQQNRTDFNYMNGVRDSIRDALPQRCHP